MFWSQFIITVEAALVEPISEALNHLGALSVTWQDAEDEPVYEPALNTTPLWGKTNVVGLFEGEKDGNELQIELQTLLAPLSLPSGRMERLAEQEWTRVCMADFHPMRFGQRVWICPSWEVPPVPEAVNICLDPGLAFGTGTHATTALCLEWLDQQADWLIGKRLIDYGCGSGVLAITAAKLGASEILAVDIDSQALLATSANAQSNGVTIHTYLPEQLPSCSVDGLMANILAEPLEKLAPTFASYLRKDAPLVLSGILATQVAQVSCAYEPYFNLVEVTERDGWMRIVAIKK